MRVLWGYAVPRCKVELPVSSFILFAGKTTSPDVIFVYETLKRFDNDNAVERTEFIGNEIGVVFIDPPFAVDDQFVLVRAGFQHEDTGIDAIIIFIAQFFCGLPVIECSSNKDIAPGSGDRLKRNAAPYGTVGFGHGFSAHDLLLILNG